MGRIHFAAFLVGCALTLGFTFPAAQCNAQQAQTPTFSPAGGSYSSAQTVTMSDGTSGATIYYTTDGSTPTTSSAVYSAPISVSTSQTLSAIAVASGDTNSAVQSATYSFGGISAPVFIQQCNGFQAWGTSLSCTLSGVRPGDALLIGFWGPSSLDSVTSSAGTPQAVISDGYGSNAYILSNTAAGTITITGNVSDNERMWLSVSEYSNVPASPLDTASAGACLDSCSYLATYDFNTTSDADLLWSFCAGPDGVVLASGSAPITWNSLTTPSGSGAGLLVEDGLAGSAGTYYGQCQGGGITNVISIAIMGQTAAPRAATPTFSPAPGSYISSQTVTISSTTPSAMIYYTTDGTTPTTSSNVYSGPITVNTSETIKAIATASGYTQSLVASAIYSIGAAPAYVQQCNSFQSWGSSLSCTMSGVKSGDLLMIGFYGPTSLMVTTSNGTPLNVISDGFGSNAYILSNAPAGTITITGSVSDNESMWLSVAEYTNVDSSPLDGIAQGICGASCPAITTESFNTSAGSDRLWSLCWAGEGAAITPGASPITWNGLPTPAGSDSQILVEDGITGSSGSYYGQCNYASSIITVALMGQSAGSRAATPTFSPAPGSFNSPQTVTISTTTQSATIYYTTDGTTPTTSSSEYTGPIAVTSPLNLKAIAVANGDAESSVGSGAYAIGASPARVQQCSNFQANTNSVSCTISGVTAGDALVIGVFGPWPSDLKSVLSSSGTPVSVVSDGEFSNGYILPNAPSGNITIVANTYDSVPMLVTVDEYTNVAASPVDGSDAGDCDDTCPSLSGSTFNTTATGDLLWTMCVNPYGPTVVPGSAPISWTGLPTPSYPETSLLLEQGLTGAAGSYYGQCGQADNLITIALKGGGEAIAATPTFSPASGSYASIQSVTITTTTPSATIYYTTDGSTPTITSNVFSGPITVSSSETIQAIATASGYTQSIVGSATYTISAPVSLSLTPANVSLTGGQTQQMTATVSNTSNTAVTWSINPAGTGSIDSSGLYTAPAAISTQQAVTVTATSQADPTKSASTTIYLLPPCTSNGYSYVRAITIDHTKVPNTDQLNFPFLFTAKDPSLRSTANGGHVTNAAGDDIIFTSDSTGLTKLDFEVEDYDPVNGQLTAWVRIPSLSHTVNTALYLFYGNSSVTNSQQNPSGVWGSNFVGVWHFPNGTTVSAADSSANGNAGTPGSGVATSAGEIDGGASLNGTSSGYISLPGSSSAWNFASDLTVSAWIKTSDNGKGFFEIQNSNPLVYLEVGPTTAGGSANKAVVYFRTNSGSVLVASGTISVNDGKWHHIQAVRNTGSSASIYVDGLLDKSTAYTDNGAINASGGGASIGGLGSSYDLNGSIDEVRVSNVARSADWIATEYASESDPGDFYSLGSESDVAISPAAVSLYGSQTQQFNAAVLAPGTCSPAVLWSMSPGSPGALSGDGLYTAPASITARQSVIITATNSTSPADTGTAIVTLLPPPQAPALSLAASAQPPYVTGSSQQFIASLKDRDGLPLAGVAVSFAVSGVNTTAGSVLTNNAGVATLSYTGSNSGNDTIQASAAVEGAQVNSSSLSVSWLVPAQSISTTTVTGQFFFSNDSCSFSIAPNTTPAFVQEFPTINFNAGSYVPGNTSGVNGGTRPFTDITTDINGNFTGTIVAQGNGYQAGVTTSTWDMGSFEAVFQGTFVVATAGNVTFNFVDDDGFILGVGNGATRVSGSNAGMPATTPFAQYPAMGAYNGPSAGLGNQVVVNFPTPGTYPYEVDYTECHGGGLMLTMAEGSNSIGMPSTGALTLTPNSNQTQPSGGDAPFTVLATDATGAPIPNLAVGLTISGNDSTQLQATTNANGKATFDYKDVIAGTVTVQASAVIDNMVAFSNQATIFWDQNAAGSGGSGTLNISLSANDPVTLPNALQLSGTVSDSALPQGDTITTTWSELSGPGTVAFANSSQIATSASFSAPGTYVLQLAAQDLDAQGVAQITITVKPPSSDAQGWIGSPQDGTIVTGIVPIKISSSETLTSGVLSYYPADNPNNVTVLNGDTTGTGQIGTLDATELQNGQYWISLQATDSYGNSSYNLALVTVSGNYKPGRVTSTVTDLVVPADGLAIKIQRTYDSLKSGTSSDFGFGWSLGTNVELSVGSRGDVTFTLGGQRRTFYLTPQYSGFLPFFVPAFTPEPGAHGTLFDTGASCPDYFDFIVPDGNLWSCVGGGVFSPQGYVYTDPSGTSYTITAAGVLQSIVDKNGNTLTISQNGITSSSGPSVSFVRDGSGRITQIKDPQQNVYSYSYDANGNLVSVTYPNVTQSQTCPGTSAPNTSTYTYDSNHRYTSGTDNNCNALPTTDYYQSTVDSSGHCQGDCDANGLPLNGRLKSVTLVTNDPDEVTSYTTSYAYNLATDTTTITYPADSNNQVGTAIMVYDSMGDLLSSADPLNHTTVNTYDTNQNLLSSKDPLNNITCYTYDASGNQTSVSIPALNTCSSFVRSTSYNDFSEPTQTIDENGNVRTFNYDVNFNPSTVTDSLGTLASFSFANDGTMLLGAVGYDLNVTPSKASVFTYDANGNMTSRKDALGRTTSYTYDSLGHKATMVEPVPTGSTASAATTTYQYDAFGDLTQTTAPLNRITGSQYDGNGNKISDTDARNKTTNYHYDALNRLIETDYPDSTKSTKTYDFRGNLVTETDQAGHVTKHVYDVAGRETSVTQAYGTSDATTTTYVYDSAGRKTSETDGLNHTTNYSY